MSNKWSVLPMVLFSAVLLSCSSDSESAADSTTAGTVTATAETAVASDVTAATVVEEADLGELPEGRGIVTDNADGTRTVVSSYGTAVVPANPQRVISVVGDIDFEAMLALGVKPVGAGTQGGTVESGFAPHLGDLVDGIEAIPWTDGVQAEAILALEPDLIFVPNAETAELLDDVATVVPRGSWAGSDWKLDFLYVGEVLGLRDEAAAMIADYEADAAALAAEIAPLIDGKTVLSPQVAWDHTQAYVDSVDSFSSVVLSELGFDIAPLASDDNPDGIAVSWEQLDSIDADFLFWQVRQADDGSPDTEGLDIIRATPLFSSVPAVAAGQMYEVPNRPWYFPTILGARQILDDVRTHLLPG